MIVLFSGIIKNGFNKYFKLQNSSNIFKAFIIIILKNSMSKQTYNPYHYSSSSSASTSSNPRQNTYYNNYSFQNVYYYPQNYVHLQPNYGPNYFYEVVNPNYQNYWNYQATFSQANQFTFPINYQTKSEAEIRSLVKEFRTWHDLGDNSKRMNGLKFRLMCYNILSQNLIDDHRQLYQSIDPNSLNWPERGVKIMRELKSSNADIICLQEVHFKHFREFFWPSLKSLGYNTVYKKKTGNKLDGCAIIYNPNKFVIQDCVKLEFFQRDISNSLDRDNVAIIIIFKPLLPELRDTKLVVATTHLLYNPRRGDVKLAQLRLLLAEIDKLAFKSIKDGQISYHPVILCGDMNSQLDSPLYSFITKGYANFKGIKVGDVSGQLEGRNRGNAINHTSLDVRGVSNDSRYINRDKSDKNGQELNEENLETLSHNLKLHSVYPNDKSLISTNLTNEQGLVDYIFYGENEKLKLLGYKKLLTDKQMDEIRAIPNAYLGSDHLSLCAKFLLCS